MNWYEVLTALLFGLGVVCAIAAIIAAVMAADNDRRTARVRLTLAASCALTAVVLFALTAGLTS